MARLLTRSLIENKVHIIPRREGDFKWNDDLYSELEKKEAEERRKPRSDKEMEDEAVVLRQLFPDHQPGSIPADLLPIYDDPSFQRKDELVGSI